MLRHAASLLTLFAAVTVTAAAAGPTWSEVRTPHFVVLTDAGAKQGVRIADQFERMRSVFHNIFLHTPEDSDQPIQVVAVKDKKGFQALEPTAYLAKGKLQLAGYFLQTSDKNYILLRLDAEGEHPYSTVYHEYTHYLLRKQQDWLPLWLNEGLAQFFENTDIRDKDVLLGQPSPYDLQLLRENRLLPLPTLLTVDHNSPYYHEEQQGSIFYAESWALVHYFEVTDHPAGKNRLGEYASLVANHKDSVSAAEQAFGDLNALQKTLSRYVSQAMFQEFRSSTRNDVDDSKFAVQTVSLASADAVRADLLAYNNREQDARALLDSVLQAEPGNVLAHETEGYLAFRAGKLDEAEKYYGQAVQLDSHSFIAQYYFAAMAMRDGQIDDAKAKQIEASLRTAIKLNPTFAEAYDRLAVLYGQRHEKLEVAHTLDLQAVTLDPANANYRLNLANLLVELQRASDALRVLKQAETIAKPEEKAMIEENARHIEAYLDERREAEESAAQASATVATTTVVHGASANASTVNTLDLTPARKYPVEAQGPSHTLRGVIRGVHCSYPKLMELKVESGGKTVALYSNDFFKVEFSAADFTPKGDLDPCSAIEGMKALVTYAETTDKSIGGQVKSIELFK